MSILGAWQATNGVASLTETKIAEDPQKRDEP
jgi:hypothetical protein